MNTQNPGLMLVMCAPSGTGKTTLVKRLLKEFPGFAFSVSYTTRKPRPGETPGQDYHFVSAEKFKGLIEKGFFAEWAEVHGNFYGSPRQATLNLLSKGKDVLFDVDVQGASQLKRSMDRGAYVFIFPPSREELLSRIKKRGADNEDTIQRRMQNAREEIAQSGIFDYWIVNDDLEAAYDRLRAVYLAERSRPAYNPGLAESMLAGWR